MHPGKSWTFNNHSGISLSQLSLLRPDCTCSAQTLSYFQLSPFRLILMESKWPKSNLCRSSHSAHPGTAPKRILKRYFSKHVKTVSTFGRLGKPSPTQPRIKTQNGPIQNHWNTGAEPFQLAKLVLQSPEVKFLCSLLVLYRKKYVRDWHFWQTPISLLHWRIDTAKNTVSVRPNFGNTRHHWVHFRPFHPESALLSCCASQKHPEIQSHQAFTYATSISTNISWQRSMIHSGPSKLVTSSSSANSWLASGLGVASSSGLKRLMGSPQAIFRCKNVFWREIFINVPIKFHAKDLDLFSLILGLMDKILHLGCI